MRHSRRPIAQTALVVSALMLALTPAFPGAPGPAAPPTIQAIAIHGSVVTITVANPKTVPVNAIVTLRIATTDGTALEAVPVAVAPEGTASASVDASAPVTGVLPLGVVLDDGVPF